MTQEQITQLTRIYNTLLLVKTSGEDTLTMADSLRALEAIIVDAAKMAQARAVVEADTEE